MNKLVYSFRTTATDTDHMTRIFQSVKNIFITAFLTQMGLGINGPTAQSYRSPPSKPAGSPKVLTANSSTESDGNNSPPRTDSRKSLPKDFKEANSNGGTLKDKKQKKEKKERKASGADQTPSPKETKERTEAPQSEYSDMNGSPERTEKKKEKKESTEYSDAPTRSSAETSKRRNSSAKKKKEDGKGIQPEWNLRDFVVERYKQTR